MGARPAREALPSTLRRSPEKAQQTWRQTHDSAVQTYGEGERAQRTAFASVRHWFEQVGDHWEPKSRRGPSDEQAAAGRRSRVGGGTRRRRRCQRRQAASLRAGPAAGRQGRSSMTKDELVTALEKANQRDTARARRRRDYIPQWTPGTVGV